jgi:ribosomal protein L13E
MNSNAPGPHKYNGRATDQAPALVPAWLEALLASFRPVPCAVVQASDDSKSRKPRSGKGFSLSRLTSLTLNVRKWSN